MVVDGFGYSAIMVLIYAGWTILYFHREVNLWVLLLNPVSVHCPVF